jgi:hypothetical protein
MEPVTLTLPHVVASNGIRDSSTITYVRRKLCSFREHSFNRLRLAMTDIQLMRHKNTILYKSRNLTPHS